MSEGNAAHAATFTVTLSAAAASAVAVSYSSADGTATAGSDYTAVSGTLNFAAGETSKTIDVSIAGDTAVEADETFTVSLSGPVGATLADSSAQGTIVNDDVAAPGGGGSSSGGGKKGGGALDAGLLVLLAGLLMRRRA